jgi:hypothetical protein
VSAVAERRGEASAAYHHLLDACRETGCPLCRCLRALTVRHLGTLLAEHVTDPATRGRLAASEGFCAVHGALLGEVPDAALGVGIVYQELLDRTRQWLAATRRDAAPSPWRRAWRRLAGAPRPSAATVPKPGPDPCPACAVLADTERCYLDTLLTSLRAPELDRAWAASDGLCLPHVRLALVQAPEHPGVTLLLERALTHVDRLAGDLRRFIDKHDHRTRATFSEREAAAWTSAVGLLAGRPEVFGHAIPRRLAPR